MAHWSFFILKKQRDGAGELQCPIDLSEFSRTRDGTLIPFSNPSLFQSIQTKSQISNTNPIWHCSPNPQFSSMAHWSFCILKKQRNGAGALQCPIDLSEFSRTRVGTLIPISNPSLPKPTPNYRNAKFSFFDLRQISLVKPWFFQLYQRRSNLPISSRMKRMVVG